ncbi:DNA recombination-dependent growth factor RdgC [Pseudomonas sp. SO81]|nr:DNA recombination-dependent growth factor RdgC [Pseudomonas sp. SO81]
MWFRNLLIYRITQAIDLEAFALAAALAAKPARPCASQELTTYGFIAPIGDAPDAPLVHESSGFMLIGARKEERILPASVINDALRDKVKEIEANQLRKVYKKERDQLKDEIIQAFLPRAFTRRKSTFAAIMPAEGLIIVDTASSKQAEDLLSTLREAIGSLPVRPLSTALPITATLTDWIREQKPAKDFWISDDALLRDTDEQGSITAKHQDLTSEEIQQHLAAGKCVAKLALAWQDKLSFVLDEGLVIRRLRFEDLLQEQALDNAGKDAEQLAQLDASFVLMMLTFRSFIPALIEALGGEATPAELGVETSTTSTSSGGIDVTNLLGMNDGITATLHFPGRELAGEQIDGSADDPLYKEAVEFVRESDRASISAVQRKLKIGYNRAARMIEAMEVAGIVTAMNSNGSREVIRG